MNHLKSFLLVATLAFNLACVSQAPTVGLIHTSTQVSDGYTLFSPEGRTTSYLINNCGEKVREWNFSDNPALTSYILENGNILRAGKTKIEIRDWNDNLVWSYLKSNLSERQHHDIEPLPNGNILCLLFDRYSDTVMIANGRDPSQLTSTFKMDKIVELKPVGIDSAVIVWEWKYMDHLIQEFDSTKANFGSVIAHPELLDLNFANNSNSDYTHCNSIDYNEKLDQIILSARHLNEIMIIDHSTTTLQASGHTGGNSGMGGDFLWRWGNPQVYQQGDATDQQLFLQHDAKWIDSGFMDEGSISVYSNFGDSTSTFSSVHVLKPVITSGAYTKISGKFSPLAPSFSWNGAVLGDTVLEIKKSGVQFLSNGNFVVCETSKGQFSEFNRTGTHLWTYKNPVGNVISSQFDSTSNHTVFRANKYLSTYAGFAGRALTPISIIEDTNSLSDSCSLTYLGIDEKQNEVISILNPAYQGIVRFNSSVAINQINIYSLDGKVMKSIGNFTGGTIQTDLPPGMYVIRFTTEHAVFSERIVVVD